MAKKAVASLQTGSKKLTKAIRMIKKDGSDSYSFDEKILPQDLVNDWLAGKPIVKEQPKPEKPAAEEAKAEEPAAEEASCRRRKSQLQKKQRLKSQLQKKRRLKSQLQKIKLINSDLSLLFSTYQYRI